MVVSLLFFAELALELALFTSCGTNSFSFWVYIIVVVLTFGCCKPVILGNIRRWWCLIDGLNIIGQLYDG
jgi:hypothetical protein